MIESGMAIISLHDIHIRFGGLPLFESLNLTIQEGDHLCLLGRNGEGKSTLLKVIQGSLVPDRGEVARSPGIKIAYLDQEVPQNLSGSSIEVLEHQASLGRSLSPETRQACQVFADILELDPASPYETLSGGSRRKILLAGALASEPDLLLLDEPTNHLDLKTIEWLEQYLAQKQKTFVFITHDRAFARRLANREAELDRAQLYTFSASWDQFLERREEMLSAEQKQRTVFDKKMAQEEAWLRQGVQARRTRDEGRVRALLRMREEYRLRRSRSGTMNLQINSSEKSGDLVAEAKEVNFSWINSETKEQLYIARDFSYRISRGDKIGLIGPNGVGKTSLIRLLLGELSPESGTLRQGSKLDILYFDQLRKQLDPEKSLAWNLAGDDDSLLVNGSLRHVNAYLQDFLFSPERANAPVKILSGGERNRLLLAKLFTRPSNILVLDEPSNDLDMETLDLLEDLLMKYTGTLILVSHDRQFLDNVVSSLLVFEGAGKIQEFIGNYSEYLAWKQEQSKNQNKEKKSTSAGKPKTVQREGKKLSFKEQKELEELPALIAKKEAELESLHETMAQNDFYKQDQASINQALQKEKELANYIDQAWERWSLLEEQNQA